MKYVIRFQRACREAGTLAPEFDSSILGEATKQLRDAYRRATRNCRYWIEAVEDENDRVNA